MLKSLYWIKTCSYKVFECPSPSKRKNLLTILIICALIFSRIFTTPNPSNPLGTFPPHIQNSSIIIIFYDRFPVIGRNVYIFQYKTELLNKIIHYYILY